MHPTSEVGWGGEEREIWTMGPNKKKIERNRKKHHKGFEKTRR